MNRSFSELYTLLSMGGFIRDCAVKEAEDASSDTALRIARKLYDPHQIEYWHVVKAVHEEEEKEWDIHFYNDGNAYPGGSRFKRWFYKLIGFFEKERLEQAEFLREMENSKASSSKGMGLYNCINLPERYVLYLMDIKGMSAKEIAKLPVFNCTPEFIDSIVKVAHCKFAMNSMCKVNRRIIWDNNAEKKEKSQ
ncbi:MAG: hypothetical protein K6E32_05635 [Lachnospiraceae bacterium]|nr:hypothetical protein [Lachnospiraceae bacterium]